MAQSRCDRCFAPVTRGVFKTWRGRLVRVGADCAAEIDAEKAEERLKAQSGGVGRDAPAGLSQRPRKAR